MASQSPEQIAAAWAQGMANAGTKIQAGVQAVQVAPGQAAARQKAVWAQNTAAAQEKWAKNTAAVSLPEWQSAMIDKGLQRIATGATAAQPAFATFMTQLLPQIDRIKSTLPPRGTLDQNITRMTQFIRGMAATTFNK